ncbi:MAG: radical SAM protein [Thermodesulfobacteriota bacterium]|nr:radical SAM protein [Thermodesulfobacteriota bacterium]
MKIGLVFNPFSYKLHEENLKIVQRYFGLFPPLSLTWVAAIAERAGHEVILVDSRTLRLTKEETLDRLKEFQPDILGFMMTTYMFRETLEWIRFLKGHLKVPVMVGGYNLRVYPAESVTPPEIDFGVVNSAYYTLPMLLSELEGDRNFSSVPGLSYKENNKIIVTPQHDPPENFNDYPFPARHLLPNELYAEFPTERRNFTVMVTSKGCPRGCLFCEAGRTPYNPRSSVKVLEEIEQCYHSFKIREIDIFDYEFLIDRKRALKICEGLIEKKLDMTFACRARIDSVDESLLVKMRKAGFSRIYFGIESGVQEILDRINKGITLDQIRKTIRLTNEIGIRSLGFFMIGNPGETKKMIKQTLKFAKKLDLDYVQFSKTTAKPLTSLWKDLKNRTGVDYWQDYILGKVEEKPLPRPWIELSNEEIDKITRKAYIRYHFRLGYLLKQTMRVKSWEEFKRKFFAFLEMIFRQESKSVKDDDFKIYHDKVVRKKYFRKISKWSRPF